MEDQERINAIDKRKARKPNINAFQDHGKLPPQAIEFEEAVIGGLLLDKNCIHDVVSIISPEVFYKESHQSIYEAIIKLYDDVKPIDILTVTNELRSSGKLELCGGAFYITQITSRIASTANIQEHAGILLEKYIAREIIKTATESIRLAFEDSTDVFDLLDYTDNQFSMVNEISLRGGTMIHISESTSKSITALQKREKLFKEGKQSGISTGLKDLNRLTGGWQKSNVIILAARPGMGKTALMLYFAKSAAQSMANTCIYSLEMTDESLSDRMLQSMCEVDNHNFKKGSLTESDWTEIKKAQNELNKLPIYIDPNPAVSMRYIKSHSRIMKKKGKCDIIFLDYLQLIDMSNGVKNRNREQEVAQASRQAKIIAKELNVPIIVLAQLNREVEKQASKRPSLSNLRESGAIEQDADLVMFIYRPEYYGIKEDAKGNSMIGVGEIIIEKNRDGGTEDVAFRYDETMTRISEYEDTQSYQYPSPVNF